MATKMRIFSSLALTAAALFVVPLSSEQASAGGHGGGGMRSFGIVRTSPVIVSRVRTTTASTVRKQTVSQTKLRNFQAGDRLKNKQVVDKVKNTKLKKASLGAPIHCNATVTAHGCGGGGGSTNGTPTGDKGNGTPTGDKGNGTPTGDKGNGTPTGDKGNGTPTGDKGNGTPTGDKGNGTPTGDKGNGTPTGDKGGIIEKEKPPVIIVERPRPIYVPSVSVAPAAVAVDPPGCVYERSVRKLPGGGLQRVIVKVCPDA